MDLLAAQEHSMALEQDTLKRSGELSKLRDALETSESDFAAALSTVRAENLEALASLERAHCEATCALQASLDDGTLAVGVVAAQLEDAIVDLESNRSLQRAVDASAAVEAAASATEVSRLERDVDRFKAEALHASDALKAATATNHAIDSKQAESIKILSAEVATLHAQLNGATLREELESQFEALATASNAEAKERSRAFEEMQRAYEKSLACLNEQHRDELAEAKRVAATVSKEREELQVVLRGTEVALNASEASLAEITALLEAVQLAEAQRESEHGDGLAVSNDLEERRRQLEALVELHVGGDSDAEDRELGLVGTPLQGESVSPAMLREENVQLWADLWQARSEAAAYKQALEHALASIAADDGTQAKKAVAGKQRGNALVSKASSAAARALTNASRLAVAAASRRKQSKDGGVSEQRTEAVHGITSDAAAEPDETTDRRRSNISLRNSFSRERVDSRDAEIEV
jgi:hypothetical protein